MFPSKGHKVCTQRPFTISLTCWTQTSLFRTLAFRYRSSPDSFNGEKSKQLSLQIGVCIWSFSSSLSQLWLQCIWNFNFYTGCGWDSLLSVFKFQGNSFNIRYRVLGRYMSTIRSTRPTKVMVDTIIVKQLFIYRYFV